VKGKPARVSFLHRCEKVLTKAVKSPGGKRRRSCKKNKKKKVQKRGEMARAT